jgi:hypothetical protein
VTAIYKGTPQGGQPALLRSYDSRKEPAPEFNCTIWQAGRATSATGLAFKPIQIGQSVFIDEGAGLYNPATTVLDEATINEWPGRDVGVFISIGTGKRPHGSDHQSHLWYEGFIGEYAEARRRLISKIEGCEDTHQYMLKEYLGKRGVNTENYYRLNVEIGVGEFGMNEWNRLADISTGTRRYLSKPEVQRMNLDAAAKMARIHKANGRFAARDPQKDLANVPEAYPLAVELPADVPMQVPQSPPARPSYESGQDQLAVPTAPVSPRSSGDRLVSSDPHTPRSSGSLGIDDKFVVNNPTPSQYRTAAGTEKIAIMSADEYPRSNEQAPPRIQQPIRMDPPPLPPKTPIPGERRRSVAPYPIDDGPPPMVNMARKPDYRGR